MLHQAPRSLSAAATADTPSSPELLFQQLLSSVEASNAWREVAACADKEGVTAGFRCESQRRRWRRRGGRRWLAQGSRSAVNPVAEHLRWLHHRFACLSPSHRPRRAPPMSAKWIRSAASGTCRPPVPSPRSPITAAVILLLSSYTIASAIVAGGTAQLAIHSVQPTDGSGWVGRINKGSSSSIWPARVWSIRLLHHFPVGHRKNENAHTTSGMSWGQGGDADCRKDLSVHHRRGRSQS